LNFEGVVPDARAWPVIALAFCYLQIDSSVFPVGTSTMCFIKL